jgi:hypothetical protein
MNMVLLVVLYKCDYMIYSLLICRSWTAYFWLDGITSGALPPGNLSGVLEWCVVVSIWLFYCIFINGITSYIVTVINLRTKDLYLRMPLTV